MKYFIPGLLIATLSSFCCSAVIPPWTIPELPDTLTGDVVRDTMKSSHIIELMTKITGVHNYKDKKYVLYLNPGEYTLTGPLSIGSGARNVVIRGLTGNPGDVKIIGGGFDDRTGTTELISMANCANITLAHMSFQSAAFNGIKLGGNVKAIRIYNCHFRNIGERAIRATRFPDPKVDGEIIFCTFKNDSVHPINYYEMGAYIGGIECLDLHNWIIRYNIFEDIKVPLNDPGMGSPAIYVWEKGRNIVIENNIIANCAKGIGVGQSSSDTAGVDTVIVRNNFVVTGVGFGVRIQNCSAVSFFNNTVFRTNGGASTVSFEKSQVNYYNNIICGSVSVTDTIEHSDSNNINIQRADSAWFRDPVNGDLHLTTGAGLDSIVDRGKALVFVPIDIDGCERTGNPDIGADEYGVDSCEISLDVRYVLKGNGLKDLGVTAYPNPFNQSVVIKILKEIEDLKFEIFNIQGQQVFLKYDFVNTEIYWNPVNLPNGIYFIRLSSKEDNWTSCIINQK
jgi:hypothetical protein